MGYFDDTSGLYGDTTNNASKDYANLSATDPGQFSNSIFDRLFGGQTKKQVQQAALAQSAAPDPSPTDPTPAAPTGKPSTAAAIPDSNTNGDSNLGGGLSSGSGLVRRILGQVLGPPTHNQQGDPLVPGTPYTMAEFQKALQKLTQPDPSGAATAPFQGIPKFPAPPPSPQQMQGHAMGSSMAGGAAGPVLGTSLPPMPQAPAPQAASNPQNPLGIPGLTPPGTHSPVGYFRGGALHMMRGGYPDHLMMGLPTRMAHGGNTHGAPHMGGQQGAVPLDGQGDGRSDHVDAKLSPGEFVMDAETTALAGNGDSEAGARGMEAVRQEIRKQKGKALAKGKFSPNAKSPGYYAQVAMKGAK
jgi:hypothetical protein